MEEGLTKKEKRALAKQEKNKTKSQDSATKYLKLVVLGLVIVALGYFLFRPSRGPSGSGDLQNKFVEYAQTLGLDTVKFQEDLANSQLEAKVISDLTEANTGGFNSTPTFVLDGEKIENPASIEEFKSIVESRITDESNPEIVIIENDHTKGNPGASVVLIEYSDFQCPACAVYAPILKQLSDEFPDDLLIVYKHFPLLSIHANAKAAAIASESAAQQGKFWEYHDLLFGNQAEWSGL